MLRTVEVQFTIQDGVVYEAERPAGLKVEIPDENYSTPLILISSSIPVITTGQVLTVVYNYMHLLPNLSVVFSEDDLEEVRLFTNVDGLYLSTDQITQHITETFPGEEQSETYMGILWAGDLDRDGMTLQIFIVDSAGTFTSQARLLRVNLWVKWQHS